MSENFDKKLEELLDCYHIADPRDDLLERIVMRAKSTPRSNTISPNLFNFYRFTEVAAMVGIALFGFWLGNAWPVSSSLNVVSHVSHEMNLDSIIIGARNFGEVML